MQEPSGKRVFAGLGIIAGMIAVFAFSFFVADVKNALEKRYDLIAVFPSAPRLRVGSPVWLAGREVGTVKAIGFRPLLPDSTPSVAVRVTLPRKHQTLIRRDSRVRFTSERTIGEPVVDILPGSSHLPPLADGDTLFAVQPGSAMSVMRGIATLWRSFDSLATSAKALEPSIERRGPQIRRVVRGIENAQREFASLRAAFAAGDAGPLTDPAFKAAFEEVGRTANELGTAFANAGQRYREPELRNSFQRLSARAKTVSAQLDTLRATFANSTLSRFAQDSAITRALHQAQVELDSLVAETKRNPLRFWLGDRKPMGDPLKR